MTPPLYRPMLATPWPEAFDDEAWQFEPKWDGIRALVGGDGRAVEIRGRRGDDITRRYPEIAGSLTFDRPIVIDGEIVALGDGGTPSFERLQRRIHVTDLQRARSLAEDVPVTFVAFDLLHDGDPLVDAPLSERRGRLESHRAAVTPAVAGSGTALWAAVCELGLEGVVAKRLDSPYRPGTRSPGWRKIARIVRVRAVVGGFTPGEGGRSGTFGALLLGLWDGERLRYIGSVGTGFDEAGLRAIRSAVDSMERTDSPFHPDDLPAGSRWVGPSLVAVVGIGGWTSAGRLRQPRFLGFSSDPHDAATWQAEGPGAGAAVGRQ